MKPIADRVLSFIAWPFTFLGIALGLSISAEILCGVGGKIDPDFYVATATILPVLLVALLVPLSVDRDQFHEIMSKLEDALQERASGPDTVRIKVEYFKIFLSAVLATLAGETASLIAIATAGTSSFLFLLATISMVWEFTLLIAFEGQKYLRTLRI